LRQYEARRRRARSFPLRRDPAEAQARARCADRRATVILTCRTRKPQMATDLRRKDELPRLTARILETYANGKINHLGHCPLPNLSTVIDIVENLKEVIFPGYRRRQNLHFGNVAYHVGALVDSLHDSLTQQFARALRHEHDLRNSVNC